MQARAITVYCDDVKPYLGPGSHDLCVLLGDASERCALTRVDGAEGRTEGGRVASLDLDHDEGRAIQAKRVDFAARKANVPPEHAVAGFGEERRSEVFARPPLRGAHAGAASTAASRSSRDSRPSESCASRTRAQLARWCTLGPCARKASMCSGVEYPLCSANP